MFCHTLLFFVILCYFYLYFVISCHTELSQESEVSIKSKRKFAPLRRGFFTLNLECILNSVDISLTLNMTIWIFCFVQRLNMTIWIFCSFLSLKMTKPLSYWAFAEVSIKSKCGFFALQNINYGNAKFMDFSLCANALRSKWQNLLSLRAKSSFGILQWCAKFKNHAQILANLAEFA